MGGPAPERQRKAKGVDRASGFGFAKVVGRISFAVVGDDPLVLLPDWRNDSGSLGWPQVLRLVAERVGDGGLERERASLATRFLEGVPADRLEVRLVLVQAVGRCRPRRSLGLGFGSPP